MLARLTNPAYVALMRQHKGHQTALTPLVTIANAVNLSDEQIEHFVAAEMKATEQVQDWQEITKRNGFADYSDSGMSEEQADAFGFGAGEPFTGYEKNGRLYYHHAAWQLLLDKEPMARWWLHQNYDRATSVYGNGYIVNGAGAWRTHQDGTIVVDEKGWPVRYGN